MAKKYHLDQLEDSIVREVSSRKMTTEKLLEAAKVAESNAHLEKFSNPLYHICSSFVNENLESVQEVFVQDEVGEENSYTLHRLMARANRVKPKPPPVCENCKQNPCLHGQVLSRINIVVGALVFLTNFPNNVESRRIVGHDGSDVMYLVNDQHPECQIDLSNLKYRCE